MPLFSFDWLRRAPTTLALAICATAIVSVSSSAAEPPADVLSVFENRCFTCHGYGAEEGELALDPLLGDGDRAANHDRWLAVWKNLRAEMMPPSGEDQPTLEERARLVEWIERGVFQLDPQNPDPGQVTIRRLNREEYRNSVDDLLGVDFDVKEEFPPDDTGYGFDTIGDVLSLSPLLMEKYLEAAEEVVSKAAGSEGPRDPARTVWADRFPGHKEGEPGTWNPPEGREKRTPLAREILRTFADRAFRRPVDEPTLDRLTEMAMDADEQPDMLFGDGIAHAMTAILASPRFLFRAEAQPEPNNAGKTVRLDEFALASRLSYFLWSSAPDAELFELARQGKLRENLRPQVDRMLVDDKAERLVRNFVGQWLQTRDVENANIDARRVLGFRSRIDPNRVFGRSVRRAMRKETEMLFAH
ncbi:MAG: DUF1587 domain-containing protein, partial [Planctomycetes bacterium]|nr:DUF1587 domain-containing protein [Planctomycetota bacterium]